MAGYAPPVNGWLARFRVELGRTLRGDAAARKVIRSESRLDRPALKIRPPACGKRSSRRAADLIRCRELAVHRLRLTDPPTRGCAPSRRGNCGGRHEHGSVRTA